jgi:hypothetical protein
MTSARKHQALLDMKTRITAILALAITWLTFHPLSVRADEKSKRKEAARVLLEKGRDAGELPDGMSIRLSACLGESDANTTKEGDIDEQLESWEFSSNQVHRVRYEYKNEKISCVRTESHPMVTKDLCKELLEGKMIETHAQKGTGSKVAFAGSRYRRGSRSIELVWKGETILELFETNGPFLQLYRETDAVAFGTLYELLATKARAAFAQKSDATK